MAGSAGFSLFHVLHGGFADHSFIRVDFGVAVFAGVCLGVERVTEGGRGNAFDVKGDVFWFHSLVATVAVGSHCKGTFAVMACSASAAFFHFRHGHGFFFAGYDFPVVTALAGSTCFGDVGSMAEDGLAKSLYFVGNITGFAFVAADTIFFGCHAKGFYTAVTCAAGLGLFHFSHGEMAAVSQVKDGVVADLAIVSVLEKVRFVTEDNRICVFESITDVFCFDCACTGGSQ